MKDDTKVEDVINKNSRFETIALAENVIKDIPQGSVIQLERRGYYYVDKAFGEADMPVLHFVPDGSTKGMSVLKNKVDAKTLTKGVVDDSEKQKADQKRADKNKKKEEKEKKKAEKKENKAKHLNKENDDAKTEDKTENK